MYQRSDILNPQGGPTQYRPERAGYNQERSQAGSLIYGGNQAPQMEKYKPSVAVHSHHNQSNISLRDDQPKT